MKIKCPRVVLVKPVTVARMFFSSFPLEGTSTSAEESQGQLVVGQRGQSGTD